ncbi:MAG: TadE/TadG family type IV pilus assembly protein [Rothia sp. (in: high G+C Gram-positive bacteria)]|nr:TadE/TadG family type IV pilus assembly protein [Rothia sp. (in: high G+C Gram-positive bacteria)]
MADRQQQKQAGNATAEFVMVSSLVLLLFLLVLQLSFALYTHNLLQDAASQGARYGALKDRTAAEGQARAEELLASSLPASYSREISSQVIDWHGSQALEISIRAPLPLVGPWGLGQGWEVQGHALLVP